MIGNTTEPIKLLKFDSITNINHLLKRLFNEKNMKVYNALKAMFMKLSHIETMRVHDVTKLKNMKYVSVSETKNHPVQFNELIRSSTLTNDIIFVDWLCKNGFQGYSSGSFLMHAAMGDYLEKNKGTFPSEIVICDPTKYVTILDIFEISAPTNFEESQNILIAMEKDSKLKKFMKQHSYL